MNVFMHLDTIFMMHRNVNVTYLAVIQANIAPENAPEIYISCLREMDIQLYITTSASTRLTFIYVDGKGPRDSQNRSRCMYSNI